MAHVNAKRHNDTFRQKRRDRGVCRYCESPDVLRREGQTDFACAACSEKRKAYCARYRLGIKTGRIQKQSTQPAQPTPHLAAMYAEYDAARREIAAIQARMIERLLAEAVTV